MFRIETRELEELVVKCPLIKEGSPRKMHEGGDDEYQKNSVFESALYEN